MATPPLLFGVLSGAVLAVVVFFGTRILLVSPGNVLALLCLVLMGLSVGTVVRRSGLTSPPALLMLAGAVLGGLLPFVL